MDADNLLIAWTTCDRTDVAERLASGMLERGLAVCVQIESSVRSLYRWQGAVQESEEIRLLVKFVASRGEALEAFILANHSYSNPEWLVVRPEHVSRRYLEWALA